MKILLVRPDGIGDQILCLPVASAIRQTMPNASIAFLSSVPAASLFEHHPDIDEVITISGSERFPTLVTIFQKGYDAAVFLKPFRRLMLAAFVARIPVRIATGYRWYSLLANRRVYQHRSDFAKHEAEYNVALLAPLGLDTPHFVRPHLVLTEAEREAADQRLGGVPSPRIVLHPGGFAARCWKGEHYKSLAYELRKAGFGVVLTGSRSEAERFCGTSARTGDFENGISNMMGALTLRELMAVIGASHAVVSGATGPAHIAAALDVPTVSLFDPRRNNLPKRWQPIGRGIVLRPQVPTCEKCIHEACPYWDCLDRITVDEVAIRVREVVHGTNTLQVLHI